MPDIFIPQTLNRPTGCVWRIWPAVAPSPLRSEPLGHTNKPFHNLHRPDPAFTFSLYPASICRSVSQLPISRGGLDSLWHPGKSVRHRSPSPKLSKNCWSHPATLLFPVTVEIVCFSFPGRLLWMCVCVCVWVCVCELAVRVGRGVTGG